MSASEEGKGKDKGSGGNNVYLSPPLTRERAKGEGCGLGKDGPGKGSDRVCAALGHCGLCRPAKRAKTASDVSGGSTVTPPQG